MKVILAVDSYKGCLGSREIEEILSEQLSLKGNSVYSYPMSDGGEGMLEAFCQALHGTIVECKVHDPLMRIITARYGIAPDGTAIIETAQACGLTLMKESERNPIIATTFGVGELIADAINKGCRKFIVGLGGSGTSDCGAGMLNALGHKIPQECEFIIASDVKNPLYGENGAAYIFSPQKGATPEMVKELDKRARQFAGYSASLLGKDFSNAPGAGAAGGLGYAFMQYMNARIISGADLLLDIIGFDNLIKDAGLIITGEGHADKQTLMGKLPERVLNRAKGYGIPVWLVAGHASDIDSLLSAGFNKVVSITPEDMNLEEAVKPENTRNNIVKWIDGTDEFNTDASPSLK